MPKIWAYCERGRLGRLLFKALGVSFSRTYTLGRPRGRTDGPLFTRTESRGFLHRPSFCHSGDVGKPPASRTGAKQPKRMRESSPVASLNARLVRMGVQRCSPEKRKYNAGKHPAEIARHTCGLLAEVQPVTRRMRSGNPRRPREPQLRLGFFLFWQTGDRLTRRRYTVKRILSGRGGRTEGNSAQEAPISGTQTSYRAAGHRRSPDRLGASCEC